MMTEQPTFIELWEQHFETLDEERRVAFLLTLKRMAFEDGNLDAKTALVVLASKWIISPIAA